MIFEVVNTLTVIDTNKGTMINIAIGKPILVSKLVLLCNLFNLFIIFIFKLFVIVDSANIQQHLNINLILLIILT